MKKRVWDIEIACNHSDMGKFDDFFFLPKDNKIALHAMHRHEAGKILTLFGLLGEKHYTGVLRELFLS